MVFDVLFVCSGNLCRSPLAERLFCASIDPTWPVQASSAGTSAVVGHPIERTCAQALRELGVDPSGHVARRLTGGMIDKADLILAADIDQRAFVVRLDAMATRRTFTIREFGRLGASLGQLESSPTAADLRKRVEMVTVQRGVVESPQPGADDIGDPYGAPLSVARACAGTIAEAIEGVLAALGAA